MNDVRPIVWFAGVGWDDVPGTDKRIVLALAESTPVIWLDSPRRGAWRGWLLRRRPAVEEVCPGVTRLRVPALPAFTRWPIRAVTSYLQRQTLKRNLLDVAPLAVVVAHPVTRFPNEVSGTRVLYLTDDWNAGASLMGYDPDWLAGILSANADDADSVAAITPDLLAATMKSASQGRRRTQVIPNGAPVVPRMVGHARQPVAGVVGQLNERLDLDMLDAVADAGVNLRLVGPRTDVDADFSRRLDALIVRPNVEWVGPVPPDQIPAQLADLAVGLTPYADTAFNRASFPLKTLEYLAAGLPVVSTDMPASRWLLFEDVAIVGSPADFADAVQACVSALSGEDEPSREAREQKRVEFARQHGWDRRAEAMRDLIRTGA